MLKIRDLQAVIRIRLSVCSWKEQRRFSLGKKGDLKCLVLASCWILRGLCCIKVRIALHYGWKQERGPSGFKNTLCNSWELSSQDAFWGVPCKRSKMLSTFSEQHCGASVIVCAHCRQPDWQCFLLNKACPFLYDFSIWSAVCSNLKIKNHQNGEEEPWCSPPKSRMWTPDSAGQPE